MQLPIGKIREDISYIKILSFGIFLKTLSVTKLIQFGGKKIERLGMLKCMPMKWK